MSDPDKQMRVHEFLKRSLIGEELIDTQFHLFSARSRSQSALDRVLKPRILCANNVLLAKGSKYFLDLLSSDLDPSDPSLIDLGGDDAPGDAPIEDYGYESDSDLEECEDYIPAAGSEVHKEKDDDESSDGGSDIFVMSPEQPSADEPSPTKKDRAESVSSSETAVQNAASDDAMKNHSQNQTTAMRLRSLTSRHVLVKDTAFQTWYTLLYYLYTDKLEFLPLGSATPGGQFPRTNPPDEPKCSAKSMYRLASKVGLDHLRDEAFSCIQNNLTADNILQELSSSLVSTHPELREMELDVLYAHIASSPVVSGFSAFARRVANRELPHGADIIVGIHARFLKESRSGLGPGSVQIGPGPAPASASSEVYGLPAPADLNASDKPEAGVEGKQSEIDERGSGGVDVLRPGSEPGSSLAPSFGRAPCSGPTHVTTVMGKGTSVLQAKDHATPYAPAPATQRSGRGYSGVNSKGATSGGKGASPARNR